jgi:hypothetical protein
MQPGKQCLAISNHTSVQPPSSTQTGQLRQPSEPAFLCAFEISIRLSWANRFRRRLDGTANRNAATRRVATGSTHERSIVAAIETASRRKVRLHWISKLQSACGIPLSDPTSRTAYRSQCFISARNKPPSPAEAVSNRQRLRLQSVRGKPQLITSNTNHRHRSK